MPDFGAKPTFLQNIISATKRKLAFVLLLQRIKSKLGTLYVYRQYAAAEIFSRWTGEYT
ncbi:hypothetical protein LEADMM271B_07485 [Leclercia adecarboxylata]